MIKRLTVTALLIAALIASLRLLPLHELASVPRVDAMQIYYPPGSTISGATVCTASPNAGDPLSFFGGQWCDNGPGLMVPIRDVVRNYGADNTGTNDVSTAFANAVTAACGSGGGMVYIPPGTFKLASQWNITGCNGTSILGAGNGQVTLSWAGPSTGGAILWGSNRASTLGGFALLVGNGYTAQYGIQAENEGGSVAPTANHFRDIMIYIASGTIDTCVEVDAAGAGGDANQDSYFLDHLSCQNPVDYGVQWNAGNPHNWVLTGWNQAGGTSLLYMARYGTTVVGLQASSQTGYLFDSACDLHVFGGEAEFPYGLYQVSTTCQPGNVDIHGLNILNYPTTPAQYFVNYGQAGVFAMYGVNIGPYTGTGLPATELKCWNGGVGNQPQCIMNGVHMATSVADPAGVFQTGGAPGKWTIEASQLWNGTAASRYSNRDPVVLTSSQTWTSMLSVNHYRAIVVGGGGGGGGGANGFIGGPGGGPAVTTCELPGNGAAYSVTIGAGGGGGTAGSASVNGGHGVAGGSTNVGTHCLANGGSFGSGATTAAAGNAGGGGIASTAPATYVDGSMAVMSVAGNTGANGSTTNSVGYDNLYGGGGGASNTAGTAGTTGEVILIPEP